MVIHNTLEWSRLGGNTSYFTVYISFYGNVSTFRDKGSSNFQSSKTESQKAQWTFCFSKRSGLSNCNKLFASCVQALTIIEFQNSNLSKVCCQDVATNARQSFSKHHFQYLSQHQQLLRRYLHRSHQPILSNMIQSLSEWTRQRHLANLGLIKISTVIETISRSMLTTLIAVFP